MTRNWFKELIRSAAYLLYVCLPKWNHAILWGWPVGEDSTRALAMQLPETSVRHVIIFADDVHVGKMVFGDAHRKIKIVDKGSLHAWIWLLTARYVFFTHRCFMRRFPRRVVSVNVWHGMIFKQLGGYRDPKERIRSRYALATSEFWKPIVKEALGPFGNILSTGLPRNDRLFLDRAVARAKLGVRDRSCRKKIIAWLPTYRKSVRGEIHEDGEDSGSVFGLHNIDPAEINAFCEMHDIMIWVKPHPMSAFENSQELSHLLVIDDDWLHRRCLSLYEALAASDVLISDISSVAIDYLLLDLPIIHCFPDIDVYRNTRGFTMEPIEDYFMGPTATDWEALKIELKRICNDEDSWRVRRRELRALFHANQDNKSTERLLKAIGLC